MSSSTTETALIDAWISRNNLNKYGDPVGTVYAGGTPLFDETTGTSKDRILYITQKHPDAPWRNATQNASSATMGTSGGR